MIRPGQYMEWARGFEIPWDKIPANLMKPFHAKKVPEKRILLRVNRIIGDIIYDIARHPGRQALKLVAEKMCSKYPASFQNMIPGFGVVGSGSEILVNRLSNYLDNKNR